MTKPVIHSRIKKRFELVRDYAERVFVLGKDRWSGDNSRFWPLAILVQDAVLRVDPELAPSQIGSRGYIHGRIGSLIRTTDASAIWAVQR